MFGALGRHKKMNEFVELLVARKVMPDQSTLDQFLHREWKSIASLKRKIFVCEGRPCRQHEKFSSLDEKVKSHFCPLEIERTICQWSCGNAPVASVKVDGFWRAVDKNYDLESALQALSPSPGER